MKRAFDMVRFPNQTFSTSSGGNAIEFSFRTYKKIMYANVSVNGKLVCAGRPCLPNNRIFPKPIEILMGASAMFVCENDDYPAYTLLGTPSCVFVMEDL